MKKVWVLSALAILALVAMMFLLPKARADGMHGVTVTKTEILVEVPPTCGPRKFVWRARWEWTADNEDVVMSFVERDEKKVKVVRFKPGDIEVETIWRAGQTVRIQRFAKGKEIKIRRLSIAGMGDELGDFSQDNWIFILDGGIPKNISPPVRDGMWGKCPKKS